MKSKLTKPSDTSPSDLRASGHPRTLRCLFKATYDAWIEDNGPRLAAALAYYALFSLAPLLMLAMAVAGATLGRRAAETALEARFYGLVGRAGAQAIQEILQDVHRPRIGTVTGVVASVLLVIGGSAMFVELRDAFNTIWRTETVNTGLWEMMTERLLSFALVFVTEVLLIISVLVTTAASALGRFVAVGWLRLDVFTHFTGIIASFALSTLLFGLMFKLLPKTHINWNDVAPAAVATALMFDAGKLLIAFYFGKSNLISAYGAAGSLVVTVGWVYYSAMILYFGAEFAKTCALS